MRLFVMGLAIGLALSWLVDVKAGPGAAVAIGAGIVGMPIGRAGIGGVHGPQQERVAQCVNGRTSKVPVLESYAWDGTRRDYGYEWVIFCEAWR